MTEIYWRNNKNEENSFGQVSTSHINSLNTYYSVFMQECRDAIESYPDYDFVSNDERVRHGKQ